jgi:hypothetical protein
MMPDTGEVRMKKVAILFFALLIILISTTIGVFATGGLEIDLEVSDKGKQDVPNSDVRHISVLGSGTETDPFFMWYDDLKETTDSLRWAKLIKTTDAAGNTQIKRFNGEGGPVGGTPENGFINNRTYGKPTVIKRDSGYGMYLVKDNAMYYSQSSDGILWTYPQATNISSQVLGSMDVVRVGTTTYLYWIDTSHKIWLSKSNGDSYTSFQPNAYIVLNTLKFAPTGQVLRHEFEPGQIKYYMFYVTEDNVHAGLAVSDDGETGWEIIRDYNDPLLTGTDPSINRNDLRDLTVSSGGPTFNMFYTAEFTTTSTAGFFSLFTVSEEENSVGFAKGRPGTVHVRPGGGGNHARTIQEGVDSVKDGGKVVVRQAEYGESVSVNRPMHVMGEDANHLPVLDFTDKSIGLNITANDVTITDIRIRDTKKQGTSVVANGVGSLVLNRIVFDRYGSKALIALNATNKVNARNNQWGTLRPANVVDGDVDFGSFVYEAEPEGKLVGNEDVLLNFNDNEAHKTVIKALEKNEIPMTPAGKTLTSVNWQITPAETSFYNPVTLRFAYDGATPASRLMIYHYSIDDNGETWSWKPLENVTVGHGYIEGTTHSFSTFSVFGEVYSSYGMNTNLLVLLAGAFMAGGVAILRKEKRTVHM